MPLDAFLSGAIAASFLVCALFFLRFWSRTKDVLFAGFALTFTLLALGQSLTTLLNLAAEERTWIYLMRLAAFIILILAIVRKNMAR
jgi:hypothetical protein